MAVILNGIILLEGWYPIESVMGKKYSLVFAYMYFNSIKIRSMKIHRHSTGETLTYLNILISNNGCQFIIIYLTKLFQKHYQAPSSYISSHAYVLN